MLRFNAFPSDVQLEFVKNGQVDDLLNEVLKNFWELENPKVQYELIKRARKVKENVSPDVLAQVFNCSEEDAYKILVNESKEVFFPVVQQDGKRFLARALVIKGTPSLITNLPSKLQELRTFGENFSVFFDNFFEGKSYMLSVAVALNCNYIPKDLAFTGRVDSAGNIYPVDRIKEKREICEQNGFRLVSPYDLKNPHIRYIKEWLDRDILDVPYYFTTSRETAESEFNKFLTYVNTDIDALRIFYGLSKEQTLQSTGRLEADNWLEVSKEFYKKISKLLYGEKGRHIHIAGRMPSALAFAFGILFGSQTPFTFYHFQNQVYIPIEINNVRLLKERTDVNKVSGFVYNYIPGGEELVILVGGAFHSAGAAVRKFLSGERYTYLLTGHAKSGNLTPTDMVEFARAVSSLIQEKRDEREFKRYHFFFSCPLPVAFMVGVSFGHYSPASIYNYEQGENIYLEVLKTEDLRKIREGTE